MNIKALAFYFLGYVGILNAKINDEKIDLLLRSILSNEGTRNSYPVIRRINVNELPKAGPLLPGHSLIRPAKTMLKSAVKFPHDEKHAVYGNFDNLGITYDKTPLRVLYTGFRKGNNILATILKAAKKHEAEINTEKGNNILATILKTVKKYEAELIKENPSLIIIQQQEPTSSKKKKKKDKTLRVLDLVKNAVNPINKIAKRSKNKRLNTKGANKRRKKRQRILNSPGWQKYNDRTRTETLDEKTKRIQDYLNSQPVPGVSLKEDTSSERATKVNEFINNLALGRHKLSLDERTKYIQDFLNNKIPFFTDGNSVNDMSNNNFPTISTVQDSIIEDENNANEIMDQYSSEDTIDTDEPPNYRRAKKKRKHRERDDKYESKESIGSDVSASSDYERNPGNPFTIHRNKYKQNWLWNHFMDGDHMNINPYGPPFANMGPSGADLFFGRKWWYYNQDDYKPMG